MRIIGIDPGINGALALLDTDLGSARSLDTPVIGEPKQREIDAIAIRRWVGNDMVHRAVIERVHAMPKQGVVGVFSFGAAYGALRAIIRMLDIPLRAVEPHVWKKFYRLKAGDKESSRQLAMSLYPECADQLSRRKDHQRAEAMLLARFAVIHQLDVFHGYPVLR